MNLGCTYNGSKFSTGGSTKINCNVCTCESSGSMNCEQSSCLVDLEIIESVNINNDNNWKATNHSQFWGQTLAQGQGFYLGTLKPTDDVMQMGSVDSLGEPDDIPSEYDLRDDVMLSPLDQGKCGASYAFSTAHVFNTRSVMAQKQGERDELGSEPQISTQHMVSCITPGGCGGGRLADTWFHIKNQGSMDEKCYGPYTSGINNDTDVCQAKLRTECSPLMSGPAYKLACEEDIQRDIINYGPVQAIMSVSHDFYHYSSGVYKSTMSPLDDDMMHSVVLIGWGNEKGVPYWLAMNSWGPEWGVGGYFKILRGQNESNIESFVIGSHPDLHGHS